MAKRAALLIAVAVLACAFWVVAKPWTADPSFSSLEVWMWPLGALMALSALSAWAFLLLEPWRLKTAASAAIILPFIAVFGFHPAYLATGVVMALLHQIAIARINAESKARAVIHPRAIAGAGMSMILVSLMIALSFAYYLTPEVQASSSSKQLPAQVAEAVEKAARQTAAIQFKDIPTVERNRIAAQVARELIGQITGLVRPYTRYFPPLLAFGLFLVLQGFSFIITPLTKLLAWGMFVLMRRTGFIMIAERDIKAQSIALS